MSPVLGRRLARFNRRVTNHITGPFAAHLPGFAVVRHTGRRSGRMHRTPVNAFRSRDGYVIALTYGTEAQWVRNVLASGGCELETRGRRIALTAPELFHDEARRAVPPPVRVALRVLGVADFMRLRR